jgi:predicted nucleic-acid-binding protein
MKYICDTNLVVRYVIKDHPEMAEKASQVLRKAKTGEITLILGEATISEIVFVLLSFYKTPKTRIIAILMDLLTYKGIETDKELISLALDYYIVHNIHFVDCILLADSKLSAIPIMTFDKKLNSIANQLSTAQ